MAATPAGPAGLGSGANGAGAQLGGGRGGCWSPDAAIGADRARHAALLCAAADPALLAHRSALAARLSGLGGTSGPVPPRPWPVAGPSLATRAAPRRGPQLLLPPACRSAACWPARAARYAEGFLFWPVVGLAALSLRLSRSRQPWLGGLLLALSAVTVARVPDWQSPLTLWSSAVAAHPTDPRAALGLARVVADADPDRALRLAEGGGGRAPSRRRREALSARSCAWTGVTRKGRRCLAGGRRPDRP